MRSFDKFIALTKVDATQREVYGIVTSETPDKEGEICDYASTRPHYEAWSAEFSRATAGKSLGNVREMHTRSAVGKVVDLLFDDTARTIAVRARIVDDTAWAKCEEGVYTGFSHGGEYAGEPWPDGEFFRYTARPSEISLVDNPCNPEAHFEYVKADGSVELRKFLKTLSPQRTLRLRSGQAPRAQREALSGEDPAPANGDVKSDEVQVDVEPQADSRSAGVPPAGPVCDHTEHDSPASPALRTSVHQNSPTHDTGDELSAQRAGAATEAYPALQSGVGEVETSSRVAASGIALTPTQTAALPQTAGEPAPQNAAPASEATATDTPLAARASGNTFEESLEKRAEADPVAKAVLECRQRIADLSGAVQNLTTALQKLLAEPMPRKTAGAARTVTKEQDNEPVNHNPEANATDPQSLLKQCLSRPVPN